MPASSLGTGTGTQARRARRDQRAEVGGRLDDHRAAGRREPAQAGGEGRLAAADQITSSAVWPPPNHAAK